jgi:ribonuclease Z|tara:strand:- start:1521 stop:2438 length:918 start_codon:yes stop_codon:yes gene_type:complete
LSISVKILGSNAASFAYNRHHTSQIIEVDNKHFMVDCGEGTQLQAKKYNVKLSKINHILISHLHGDHYYGLLGLLSTMHLYGRKQALSLIGPPGLSEIITIQLKHSKTVFNFPIELTEWKEGIQELLVDLPKLTIKSIPMKHSIPCAGFLFEEKPNLRRLNKVHFNETLNALEIKQLKSGIDVVHEDGRVKYSNQTYTLPPRRHHSYAFCSDTKYDEELVKWIKGVDFLYHEATFMEEMKERAHLTFHTTAAQAGRIATAAAVGKLMVGHFSTRYKDLNPLLKEVQTEFENAHLALEGRIFEINE